MATPPATPPVGTSQDSQDALAIIKTDLAQWGFGNDADQWAVQQIQSNNSIDQILYSLRQQPFYVNSVFGRVAAVRQKANLPAMTEAQILAYKDYAVGVAKQAGLPPGFISNGELVELMGNDVSTSELDARVTTAYTQALKAAPDVKATLSKYAGINANVNGALAAYYLNPNKALPLLQQQFTAATIATEANRAGAAPVSEAQATYLAQIGITDSTAKTGFTDLAKQHELFTALPGTSEGTISEATQLGAEFTGNANDARAIQERAQQRTAVFAGDYHFAETQNKGITGLGSVQRNG